MAKDSNLKKLLLFLENDNPEEMDYVSTLESEPEENKVPETIIQDDADDEPEVSDTELESALEYDNLHYGESDEVLEK